VTGLGPIPLSMADQGVPETGQSQTPRLDAALVDVEQVRTLISLYMPEFNNNRALCFVALTRIEQTLRGER
jgi:hypothetical protein